MHPGDVAAWLRRGLGLSGQYAAAFWEEQIDGAVLVQLDDDMLDELGVEDCQVRILISLFLSHAPSKSLPPQLLCAAAVISSWQEAARIAPHSALQMALLRSVVIRPALRLFALMLSPPLLSRCSLPSLLPSSLSPSALPYCVSRVASLVLSYLERMCRGCFMPSPAVLK